MLKRAIGPGGCAVTLALAGTTAAHAHHPMGYTTPATWLEGLLSGLGHPILGADHLLFIIAAGVLAARLGRVLWLPLIFVVASNAAVAARAAGAAWDMSELWLAATLVVLGAVMAAERVPARPAVGVVFAVSGALHGYALGAAVVGAEQTPLYAYLAGLTIIQCAIALGAAQAAHRFAQRRPGIRAARAAGMAVAAAGVVFAGFALL